MGHQSLLLLSADSCINNCQIEKQWNFTNNKTNKMTNDK